VVEGQGVAPLESGVGFIRHGVEGGVDGGEAPEKVMVASLAPLPVAKASPLCC